MKIDIISGFLGAGKTKLIKKLINESFYTQKVVVVENEFGEIGIDGDFLRKNKIEVKEIVSGCICCSVFNEFKNTLREIIDSQNIERIIIEPSGVGKLSEIIEITKGFNLRLNMVITVVDVTMYEAYIDLFGEFYQDQIINAATIVLSRTQNVDSEELQSVVSRIKTLNKKASIVTIPWDLLDGEDIAQIGEKAGEQALLENNHISVISHEHEEFDRRHKHEHGAADVFENWAVETQEFYSVETLKSIFNSLKNEELYGKIIRAKGIVQANKNQWIEFDFEPSQFEVRDSKPDSTGRICIIGVHLNPDKLNSLITTV